jgi:hypothetical protein
MERSDSRPAGLFFGGRCNAMEHKANAVVDLVNFYRKRESADPVKLECHIVKGRAVVVMKGQAVIMQ